MKSLLNRLGLKQYMNKRLMLQSCIHGIYFDPLRSPFLFAIALVIVTLVWDKYGPRLSKDKQTPKHTKAQTYKQN